jgi:hypothetical protein
MLYITRNRMKEALKPEDLIAINKLIDDEVVPAVTNVEGVHSAQAFNSITGEVTFVLDVENLAAVDRIMADQGCMSVLGKFSGFVVRTGGEILYNRVAWQELYGKG